MKNSITFQRFMEIAKENKASTVLETWDETAFDEYIRQFGPITEKGARSICEFTEQVTAEEEAAGRYFSGE